MRRKLRAAAHSPAAPADPIAKVEQYPVMRRHASQRVRPDHDVASIVVILSLVGLAIDTGHLQLVKVRMQTAADAAVWGRQRAESQRAGARRDRRGKADAASNGFTDGQIPSP